MIKLGKKTHYALVAMFHLDRVAPKGTRVNTHDLSQRYDIPEQHLGKVLQSLGRAGLLKSVQGVQGGYELLKDLNEIRLGDVLEALGGKAAPAVREPHTILTLFPACYVQGLAHEVERNVVERVHAMRLTEVLSQFDLPESPNLEATG
ncbi:MAG: Rrf2 family transcriptional regulator [Verrucomicrobia bacterium]|nr:Rrf2 family transcriptional regulator [Verrucomicrobiota bacterium]MCH8525637.1 Rrf2 family transcriptional regulator [Kiritimatiellia bacterium]